MKTTFKFFSSSIVAIFFVGIVISCSSDDDNSQTISEFQGQWSGTYSGDEVGIWSASISDTGVVTGTAQEEGETTTNELNGTVTSDGTFTATVGTSSNGSDFIGQLSGNNGNGTWINTNAEINGTWSGSRE